MASAGKTQALHVVVHKHRPPGSFAFHECHDRRAHHALGVGDVLSIIFTGETALDGDPPLWKRFDHSLVYYGSEHPVIVRRVDRIRRRIERSVRDFAQLQSRRDRVLRELESAPAGSRQRGRLEAQLASIQVALERPGSGCLAGGPFLPNRSPSARRGVRYLTVEDLQVVPELYFALDEIAEADPGTWRVFRRASVYVPSQDDSDRLAPETRFVEIPKHDKDYELTLWDTYMELHWHWKLGERRETWAKWLRRYLLPRSPRLAERFKKTAGLEARLIEVLQRRAGTRNAMRPGFESRETLAVALAAEALNRRPKAIAERVHFAGPSVSIG